MALLHDLKQDPRAYPKLGTGNLFAGPELVEITDSSGENTMVSTSVAHSPRKMKRDDQSQDPSPVKKIKLEAVEAGQRVHNLMSSEPVSSQERESDLPSDFLEPLSPERDLDDEVSFPCKPASLQPSSSSEDIVTCRQSIQASKQFWKAGDYEGESAGQKPVSAGMDHVRVHPKFLHSNATSHKWVLGAVAELLDNALDEVVHGATFVNVDVIRKQVQDIPMLLIEDDGGGMDPECMRHCMSLGYSAKSKMANTIGQYGNGFKTSTMRLGADVIVFSCCAAREGCKPTRSIGLLSYTFLRETGQQDIIVPMVDFEFQTSEWQKLTRSNVDDWNKNMDIIRQWSPFSTDVELLDQFNGMKHQGTRIFVYNLWEDDEGELELDFDTDPDDIQVKGVNRDQKRISMAERLPNSKHFLTYRHSLRSYASILYLRLPKNFKMVLRGKEIQHHCLVNDLMITQKVTYRPHGGPQHEDEQESGHQQEASYIKAVVTIGFVKDAQEHADIQGFNVYHKNRLIKPFWRLWNAAGSAGRGVVGVLEANFVEPAHDKQGFERTQVLARLEARLVRMQKTYWFNHSHKVGYYNHHIKKKKKGVKASRANSLALEELRPAETCARIERRKMLNEPGCQPQMAGIIDARLPKAIPKSFRSQRQRIPARRFQGSGTCTDQAVVSDEGFVMPSKGSDIWQEAVADGISNSESLKPARNTRRLSATHDISLEQGKDCEIELERIRQLEVQLLDMEQQMQLMQRNMETIIKERDLLREELDEERKHGELNDTELRKKLRDTQLRVKELELANSKLQSAQVL